MTRDYSLLGLESDASIEEVKSAYRKLAMKNHPDRNPGDPSAADRFSQITQAYQRIINPGEEPEDPTDEDDGVIRIRTSVSMSAVYTGVLINIAGKIVRLPPGFTADEIYGCSVNEHQRAELTLDFDPLEGFTRDGFDLTTEMKIDPRDIQKQKTFTVPHHPHPHPVTVCFPPETADGDIAICAKRGLPNQSGKKGDLKIKVIFAERKGFWETIFK